MELHQFVLVMIHALSKADSTGRSDHQTHRSWLENLASSLGHVSSDPELANRSTNQPRSEELQRTVANVPEASQRAIKESSSVP
eukprot:258384-Amphidinium_carterae.2